MVEFSLPDIFSITLSIIALITLGYHLAADWAVWKDRMQTMYALYQKSPDLLAQEAVYHEKIDSLVLRVNILYDMLFASGKREALSKGILREESPMELDLQAVRNADPTFEADLKDWYALEGGGLCGIDLAVKLRRKFAERIDKLADILNVDVRSIIVSAIFMVTGKVPNTDGDPLLNSAPQP